MKQVQKSKLDLYDRQIGEIMDAKAKFLNESKQELDAALELQKQLLGDAESIETDSFIVSKKYPNLKSKATYKLSLPKSKEEKVRFDRYMKEEHPGLIKEEVVIKPIQNDIKQLIVDGVFHRTEEGLLIDDNGMAIPNTTVNVKGMEVKVKVKE
ncbi:hypothetical protein RV00_GL001585 [Enterococcus devriesei]|uniref:Uncharacterized protein n=2 Tax=Enterococcus devriesei TaxID=319970 RepID=A0A1L8SW78_9ENTE|nr:hypothetical protein RV00_GL001585 [Enterococcus devriesei]